MHTSPVTALIAFSDLGLSVHSIDARGAANGWCPYSQLSLLIQAALRVLSQRMQGETGACAREVGTAYKRFPRLAGGLRILTLRQEQLNTFSMLIKH